MSKLVFASRHFSYDDPLFNKFKRLTEAGLIISSSVGFPRSTEFDFYKTNNPIPDVSTLPVLSFAETTELKLQSIIEQVEKSDKPIVVYWSGGIDSTVIVSALFKNFSKSLIKRVVIKMSNASYVENPYFFNHIIKPYFKYTTDAVYDYRDAIILHGDPADALWLGGNILTLEEGAHKLTLSTYKDNIIKSFANRTDKPYAEWLFESLIDSSNAHGYELKTVSDLYWWLIFNHNFSSMCNKHVGETSIIDDNSLSLYKENFVLWYNTHEYQAWSINEQFTGEKYDGSIRSYKMAAKEYIYDVDKNQHYRDFKTKMHSNYVSSNQASYVQAIYDDGRIILND